jgi:tetratricopeptide (TPR) repeat protein
MMLLRCVSLAAFSLAIGPLLGEQGVLWVTVEDPQSRGIAGVQLGTKGPGSTGSRTGRDGKSKIALAPGTHAGSWVALKVVTAPKEMVFLSPWDGRVRVPPFENESENYAPVVLIEPGDREALQSNIARRAWAERILKSIPPTKPGERLGDEREALAEVARIYNLPPGDIDRAIRALGQRAIDPYEKGLAALYEENHAAATSQLSESLQMREQVEAKAKAEEAKAKAGVADAAFYLGRSLYAKGSYRDSAAAYQKAADRRPDDAVVLNDLGLSLSEAGDYAAAKPVLEKSLAISEGVHGKDHPEVATSLSNLAGLHLATGEVAEAERLFRRAMEIDKKVLGENNLKVARDKSNLGLVLIEKGDYTGDYAEAEGLLRDAIAIDEKSGVLHPELAMHMANLAALLQRKKDYTAAEGFYRSALDAEGKTLGLEHPDRATILRGLALVLRKGKRDYVGAEDLIRKALAIDKNALGPEHPQVGDDLSDLGTMFLSKGDYLAAEGPLRDALAIDEKGSNYFAVSRDLRNLANLFKAKGDVNAQLEFTMRGFKLMRERQAKQAHQESAPAKKQP